MTLLRDRYQNFQEDFDDTVFASGESVAIAAGAPRLANIGGSLAAAAQLDAGAEQFARPIGFVQNFALSQNMNLMRFFETGSYRAFFMPSKVIPTSSLSRIYYNGPSMLRAIYAFYQDLLPPTIIPSVFPNNAKLVNPHNVHIPPGFENVFMNLQSDLFRQPCGLLIYMKDSNDNVLGAFYMEQCFVQSHNAGWDASGIVIQEGVSIQCERIVPIAVSSVALITGALNPLNT